MSARIVSGMRLVVAAVVVLFAASGFAAAATTLSGVVQTGGSSSNAPLANVDVTLFEATSAQPTVVGQAISDATGRFTILYRKKSSSSIFYLAADVGGGVEFVTVLGPDLPNSATIDELTTVAAGYSMAQFYRTGTISGNAFGLRIAAAMNDNLAASGTGDSSQVLLSSPNADQTNSLQSTRSLANLLAACVGDPGVTESLFALTTPPGGSPPHGNRDRSTGTRDLRERVRALHASAGSRRAVK